MRGPLRQVVVRETAWNAAGTYSALALQVVVTAVLARLLSPADFGIVATVLTFTAFFDAVSEIGLGGAVLQRPDPNERELSAIFWLTVGAALVLYLLLCGGVSFSGGLFGTTEFRSVVRVLGLNVVLVSLLVVPSAVLRRRLELRVLALSRLGAVVTGAAVGLPMAVAGYGYWSLVGQSLAAYGTQAAAVFWFSRWRPRIAFSRASVGPALRFSLPAALHMAVNYWSRNTGNLLIARFAGAAALGEFTLAQRVLAIPVQLLGSALGPTLHPTFAIIGSDRPRLRAVYGQFVQLAGIVGLSVAAVLLLTADRLVPLLWGAQWTASVGLVYALLPAAAVQPITAVSGPLYLASDRPGLMLGVGVFNAAAVLAGMTLGLRWGTWGLAWGYSLAYVCLAAPCAVLVAQRRLLRAPLGDLARWLLRPAAVGAMVLAAGWASRRLITSAPPLLALATIVAGALLGFCCALRVLAWPLVLSVVRMPRSVPAVDVSVAADLPGARPTP